ncbi:MAG: PIN domain-containing protein [Verrucomicrobia bacterium]|nr:PIN domain-containing protein [Verrucomicrobiota bacterium]
MIIPDVNVLVFAHNEGSSFHLKASKWWENALNGDIPILLPHICVNGFVRIMTHPRILEEPLTVAEALEMADVWLESDCVALLPPGMRHYFFYKQLLLKIGVGGKLTTDAYIAAMALENQATVFSNDSDFSRFSGLKWKNPINN